MRYDQLNYGDVGTGMMKCCGNPCKFFIEDGSLPEDYCTLCCEDYKLNSYVGILHGCHHYRWCYLCAQTLLCRELKCPICREKITAVKSQPYHVGLLEPNSQEEIEGPLMTLEQEPHVDLREQEILSELEEVPAAMKATKEDADKLKQDAAEILKVVSTPACRRHLRSIARGVTESERHNNYQESGMLYSGLGPFTLFEDMKTQLLEIIDKQCRNDPVYQWSVMIPEAVIFGAQIIFKVSKPDAVAYYEKTSKLVAVQE
ncbi:uncharacterized protein LOC117653164 [Thrips palmi]|uniref:Uncharacterized protein LOC117653164 n=1 Tax=Thrips palmi TaxID=161013 RepID=A0A6P9AAT0_THRPL|nr:uncharacterized protein LOC117653164 [Thrips palmi]